MKPLKSFIACIFSALSLTACSGNSAANAGPDSTTNHSSPAGSGDDMYYELTTVSTGRDINMNGITKMFVSSKGDMRVEMTMSSSFKGKNHSSTMVIVGHSVKPDETITIDDETKTFTVNHINRDDEQSGEKIQSTATKIGEEKIMGFNCLHVRIISAKTLGSFSSHVDTIDLWRSNDVPVQASVKELMERFQSGKSNSMYSQQTAEQLKQMGLKGFTVKMQLHTASTNMTMQLTKIAHDSFSASLFAVPAGYKENKD